MSKFTPSTAPRRRLPHRTSVRIGDTTYLRESGPWGTTYTLAPTRSSVKPRLAADPSSARIRSLALVRMLALILLMTLAASLAAPTQQVLGDPTALPREGRGSGAAIV